MQRPQPGKRYGSWAIGMHWLMLALLIGVYSCILLHDWYPRGNPLRDSMKTWHFMLGLTVFALVFLRLAIRLLQPPPRLSAAMPAWQRHLATFMHIALYGFLIVMPLLGWLTLSAGGKTIPFFGLQLPPLIAVDKDFSRTLKDIHETIGTIGYYLIGVHAAAALYHHYVLRDDSLLRMLPSRRSA